MDRLETVCDGDETGWLGSSGQPLRPTRLKEFWRGSTLEKADMVAGFYWALKTRLYYRMFFGRIGNRSKLQQPLRLKNPQNIFIEDGVTIHRYAFLLTLTLPGQKSPRLVIESGCTIGHFSHITSVDEVVIGPNVLLADRVHISDNTHVFSDPTVAVVSQGVASKGKVKIGEGSWIGEGASILSCSVGKHCIIGSNAVVVHDVPDYSVAAGVPARVIRTFNPITGLWEKRS